MIDEDCLLKEHLRTVLARRSSRALDAPDMTCAAVLVPLLLKTHPIRDKRLRPAGATAERFPPGGWHVLVTLRAQTVEHHKGQISFPGGACQIDDRDQLATALRETYEEIGIPPEAVEVLGALDDLATVTGFAVKPYVGVIPNGFPYKLNRQEVEAVIEIPLSFLLDPANLRSEQLLYQGQLHEVLYWDYGRYTVWGATARILKGLLDLAF